MSLPVNIDTTYADTGGADVKLHQQHHDSLHTRYNRIIHLDDSENSVTPASAKTGIDTIVAAAPAAGSNTKFTVVFGDNRYVVGGGLAAFHDKNIDFIASRAYQTPDGSSGGSWLVAGQNSATLMQVGNPASDSDIYYNGPLIQGLGFDGGGFTGVTGLLTYNVDHMILNWIGAYRTKFGAVIRRKATSGDSAWTDMFAPTFKNIGTNDTTGGAAGIWFDGGCTFRVHGGQIGLNKPASGRHYGVLISPTTNVAGGNGCKFFGLKVEGDNDATDRTNGVDRTTGFAVVPASTTSGNSVYNEINSCFFEALGTGVQAGGNASQSSGKGTWMRGGHISNAVYGFVADTNAVCFGMDEVGMESVTNRIVDNSGGQGHFGRILAPGVSSTTGQEGSDKTNVQTNTTYTVGWADRNRRVELSNGSAIAVTIPTNATTPFPIGSWIEFAQSGAGAVTLSGAGVTLRSRGSLLSTNGQYAVIRAFKRGTDEWVVDGDRV